MKRLRQEGERMVEFWVALTGLLPISFLTAPEIPPPEYPPPPNNRADLIFRPLGCLSLAPALLTLRTPLPNSIWDVRLLFLT